IEVCPCFEISATSETPEILALFNQFLSCTTFEDVNTLYDKRGEEECMKMYNALTEEHRTELTAHLDELFRVYIESQGIVVLPPAVNYANVAPFVKFANSRLAAGRSVPMSRTSENGIEFTKTVTETENDTFTITLEAFTTGQVTTSTENKPCDIILVLDRSTSMNKDFYDQYKAVYGLDQKSTYYVYVNNREEYEEVTWCSDCNAWTNGCWDFLGHYSGIKYKPMTSADDKTSGAVQFYVEGTGQSMSRMEALHSAANKFVTSVNTNSPDSRIAVVSFGQNGYIHTGNASTALLDVSDNEQDIRNAISGVSADESATEHGKGLALANNIFASSDSTGRNRVVVMITDGEPAPRNTGDWSSRVVKQALDNAYSLKHTYSASVYCISVMPGTNAANPTSDMDKFMSYVSSNYPDAQYTGSILDNRNNDGDTYYTGSTSNIINQITPGAKADTSGGSFYLTASDLTTLDNIFEDIANQTGGSKTELGTSAVVRDVVTPYFTMPTEAQVTVQSYDCLSYDEATGNATWAATGTDVSNAVSIKGTTIDVSNFDFNRNFVAQNGRLEGDVTQAGDFHGRKLVITFEVTPNENFLGGNGVPTNVSAGVYENAEATSPLSTAEADPVDVDVKTITPDSKDQNIYLTKDFDPDVLRSTIDSRINGTNNAYADVTYTIWDGNTLLATYIVAKGQTTGEWAWEEGVDRSPSDDQTFTVKCKVDGGTGNTSEESKEAKVKVFLPTLTFKDSEVYYGDTVPTDFTLNLTDTKWKHGDTVANEADMGTAPALTISYTPEDGKIDGGKINTKQDVKVNAVVKIGETAVTSCTTFLHSACTGTCDWTETTLDGSPAFLLHVKTCQLTITKTGGASDEPYVFTVYRDGDKYSELTIVGNGSGTICELPVGVYTIEEDTGWSWRYTPSIGTGVTLSSDSSSGTITCGNTKTENYWLNGFSDVVENVFGAEPNS
ncbi:vWA domain-containing protein, partial [Dysosmobacter sp.]|uniref:vWA domain-containing protein n=1 Tax=Dysosmobacter sp. TaxID=2591382 RepID=UPI003AEF94FC